MERDNDSSFQSSFGRRQDQRVSEPQEASQARSFQINREARSLRNQYQTLRFDKLDLKEKDLPGRVLVGKDLLKAVKNAQYQGFNKAKVIEHCRSVTSTKEELMALVASATMVVSLIGTNPQKLVGKYNESAIACYKTLLASGFGFSSDSKCLIQHVPVAYPIFSINSVFEYQMPMIACVEGHPGYLFTNNSASAIKSYFINAPDQTEAFELYIRHQVAFSLVINSGKTESVQRSLAAKSIEIAQRIWNQAETFDMSEVAGSQAQWKERVTYQYVAPNNGPLQFTGAMSAKTKELSNTLLGTNYDF